MTQLYTQIETAVAQPAASLVINPKDLLYKVREDPLFGIKKKEQDNVRSIMDNPFKMQQIRQVGQGLVIVDSLMY